MICASEVRHDIGTPIPLITHGKDCRKRLASGEYEYKVKSCSKSA